MTFARLTKFQTGRKNKLNNNNEYLSWDALTYDKVSSNVQLAWGLKLLDKKRTWVGDEIVMDAGAGSGNLAKIIADKVPRGKVYAVDTDPNMISKQSQTYQPTKMCKYSNQVWTR